VSAGALLLLDACRNRVLVTAAPEPRSSTSAPTSTSGQTQEKKPEDGEPEVTATEDMMREHGVLRRALVVYSEAAKQLRTNAARVSSEALQQTAKLFRNFGEDYHEKKLEEAHVFPAVKKAGGAPAALTDVLIAQHERGRQITDYILAVTAAPKIGAKAAELASVFESFVRMYDSHTAREDTIVFPAWKKTLTSKELDEMGDKFEDIEHAQFGGDGFDIALKQISSIEDELGLSDLSRVTAPPPPKSA
jgi:hemerythrin-like domain-containing protein